MYPKVDVADLLGRQFFVGEATNVPILAATGCDGNGVCVVEEVSNYLATAT